MNMDKDRLISKINAMIKHFEELKREIEQPQPDPPAERKEMNYLNRRNIELEGALKVIHTWALFCDGEAFDRHNVISLCKRVLFKDKEASRG